MLHGIALAPLLLLLRQPGPWEADKRQGWDLDDLDLLDWMEQNGVKPGGDFSGWFGRKDD